jgi:hypothetical protein
VATRRLTLADIKRELRIYEKKYSMSSEEFQAQYRGGQLEGTRDFVRWMGLCDMLVALKASSKGTVSA